MNYYIDAKINTRTVRVYNICKKKYVNTLDLICISILSDDNRELFLLNKECNIDDVWDNMYLRDNVLSPIYCQYYHGDMRNVYDFTKKRMKEIFKICGVTLDEINESVINFILPIDYFVKALNDLEGNVYETDNGEFIAAGIGTYYTTKYIATQYKNAKEMLNFDKPVLYTYGNTYQLMSFYKLMLKEYSWFNEYLPETCYDLLQVQHDTEEHLASLGQLFGHINAFKQFKPDNTSSLNYTHWYKQIYELITQS